MIGRVIARGASITAAAMLLLAAAPAGSDGDPAGYQLRLPLTVAAGDRVQRLALPAVVLAALQTQDGHDVRVFDARDRAMPIARGAASTTIQRVPLAPMPILGAPDALKISGVSLRLDGRGHAQVAEVSGAPIAAGGAPELLGVLLDARAVQGGAARLSVDADLPVGQPVTLLVDASTDLRDWRRLGEATLYRRSGDTARPSVVPLQAATIARDYLRISWSAGSRLLSPVAIRTVALDVRPDGARETVAFDVQAPAPTSGRARVIDFAVPFATPIASLRVMPAADDGIIPVRILGRDDREQPWTLLGRGIASADDARDIALDGGTPHEIRIEADARSAGFAAAPRLRIGFAARSLIFLASGTAPFTLSAGRSDAKDLFLDQGDITDGRDSPGAAQIASVPEPSIRLLPLAPEEVSLRSILLWGVLLGATALLAGIAWLLWRQQPPKAGGDCE
ncbi:DUF3999 family protein [Sphingomonas sp. R86520]|uniref:DUF3999 family protein n=1 Tax=Sphingomonas sp. R86520 TaxID=3093859 RepID=UPI0036D22093